VLADKREDLLAAAKRYLTCIASVIARKAPRAALLVEIGRKIGAVLDMCKMAKQLNFDIPDTRFILADLAAVP